jgi:hypothetical protein
MFEKVQRKKEGKVAARRCNPRILMDEICMDVVFKNESQKRV